MSAAIVVAVLWGPSGPVFVHARVARVAQLACAPARFIEHDMRMGMVKASRDHSKLSAGAPGIRSAVFWQAHAAASGAAAG